MIFTAYNSSIEFRFCDIRDEYLWLFILNYIKLQPFYAEFREEIERMETKYYVHVSANLSRKIGESLQGLVEAYQQTTTLPEYIDKEIFLKNEHWFHNFSNWAIKSCGWSLFNGDLWRIEYNRKS